jgi:glycosidase
MGENLAAEGRLAVRTPMQWTSERNGGFSTAAPSRLTAPVVEGGFAPEYVNVADQRRDPDSLLAFIALLIRRYRECPELGWAVFDLLDQPFPEVLAHLCSWDDGALVAVHNLGPEPRTVPLMLDGCDASHHLADLLVDGTTPLGEDGAFSVSLDGYGYRWLRVNRPGSRRLV